MARVDDTKDRSQMYWFLESQVFLLRAGNPFLISNRFVFLRVDICKDTSDDEYSDANSSHTEGFAVMDVIEYELPDDSESEDDLSSASSGSEVSLTEFLLVSNFFYLGFSLLRISLSWQQLQLATSSIRC